MAMYYQGSSEIQATDGLHTLYLMNPNCVGYSDTQHPPQSNMLFLNSATTAAATVHALSPALMPHAPLHQSQQFVSVPLSHEFSRPSPVLGHQEDINTAHNIIPRFHYNNLGLVDQTTNENQTNMAQQSPRGLSLSLSAHQTGFDKSINSGDHQDFPVQYSIGISPKIFSSPSKTATETNGINTSRRTVITGSKYLKAAQELLDEVANVGKEWRSDRSEASRDKAKAIKDSNNIVTINVSSKEGESANKDSEFTTAQIQEIQLKKAKLNSMLDEVEQRYRKYCEEMQIVVASFEEAAGIGKGRSYTQLALKAILKQFKWLKSRISAQIKGLNKRLLGEDESEKMEGSKLKYEDHHHQQRTMQQMGMMQNNAWRPQRGLPERAVSLLRAWLFQHFLHPYPKDSDKQMLAKQTGLTRSQVSNWFINARVRLWKPMVEEMYLEETKNQEPISSDAKELRPSNSSNTNNTKIAKIDPDQISAGSCSIQPRSGSFAQLITSLNMEKDPQKLRNRTHHDFPSTILSADQMEVKAGERMNSKGFNNYLSSMAAANANRIGIGELQRFSADQQVATPGFQGNSFSLTLALPPIETSNQHNFLSHPDFEFDSGINVETIQGATSQSTIGYEMLDFQNRKPFLVSGAALS